MVEGRKSLSSELKKNSITWQLDNSRPPPLRKSRSMKRSASSMVAALISSLGGNSSSGGNGNGNGSGPGSPTGSCGPTPPKSRDSSFTASGVGMTPPAGSLTKPPEMSPFSWHGSSASSAVSPAANIASFTDPGTLTAPRSPSKHSFSSSSKQPLLPEAGLIPAEPLQHKRSSSTVSFLPEFALPDDDDSPDGDEGADGQSALARSSTGNLSTSSTSGWGQTKRLGSTSTAAVVQLPRSLSAATSAAGHISSSFSMDPIVRQKSRVSFLIDEETQASMTNSWQQHSTRPDLSGSGTEDLIAAVAAKPSTSHTDYKRSHTTALTDLPSTERPRSEDSEVSSSRQQKTSAFKSSISAAFAKLSVAIESAGGKGSRGDGENSATAYKVNHGYLPSPSAPSAGGSNQVKHGASGKSSLSRAGSTSLSFKAAAGLGPERSAVGAGGAPEDADNVEDEESLLPALPPGVIPLFVGAGGSSSSSSTSNGLLLSSGSRASAIPPAQSAAAGARSPSPLHAGLSNKNTQMPRSSKSSKALNPPIQQQGGALLLEEYAAQFAVAPVIKPLSLAPASQVEPVLLAVSPRLAPALQREVWRLADFVVHKKLYDGYASTICKAVDRVSGATVALKMYHLSKLNSISSHQVAREVRLHIGLDHENIIALYAAFQEAGKVVLVQEFAAGGDLWSFIDANSGRLTERVTVSLVLQPFLRALQYLHSTSIAHRDIKPENVLFSNNMVLKIADFGLAVNLREERAVTRVGTLDYMAPEVLRCPLKRHPGDNKDRTDLHYSHAVDAWAVGVLAYELLTGRAPFSAVGARDPAIETAIQSGSPSFPSRMSEPAVDFIAAALNKAPDRRPGILQMLHHPWIRSFQRSSSNGRAEKRSSRDFVGDGRLLMPGAASGNPSPTSGLPQQQQQAQRQLPQPALLPQLTAKPTSKTDVYSSGGAGGSAAAAAAGVYRSDDNGMTGYAGGW